MDATGEGERVGASADAGWRDNMNGIPAGAGGLAAGSDSGIVAATGVTRPATESATESAKGPAGSSFRARASTPAIAGRSVGAWTMLRGWLWKNGYFMKKGVKGEETHLLFDGGRVRLTNAKSEEDFLRVYARSIFSGEWVYVIEKKTEVFNMMMELDLLCDHQLSREEVLDFARYLQQQAIRVSYDASVDIRMVVCTAPPPMPLEPGKPVKNGIHLLFSKLRVRIHEARILRAMALSALQKYDRIKPVEPWAVVLDPCVYDRNGLRMIGSRKAEECEVCDGTSMFARKPRADLPRGMERGEQADEIPNICPACGGIGKVDRGRPYSLYAVLDSQGAEDMGELERLRDDVLELVRATSIRVSEEGAEPAKMCLSAAILAMCEKAVNQEPKRQKKGGAANRKPGGGNGKKDGEKGQLESVPPESKEFDIIARTVEQRFEGSPRVTSILKTRDDSLYIAKSNSHYCLNKCGTHKHSTVYFIVKPSGIVQRCWSVKPVAQPASGKPCCEFTSTPRRIPRNVANALFTQYRLRITRQLQKREQSMAATHYASEAAGRKREREGAGAGAAAAAAAAGGMLDDEEEQEGRMPEAKRQRGANDGAAAMSCGLALTFSELANRKPMMCTDPQLRLLRTNLGSE